MSDKNVQVEFDEYGEIRVKSQVALDEYGDIRTKAQDSELFNDSSLPRRPLNNTRSNNGFSRFLASATGIVVIVLIGIGVLGFLSVTWLSSEDSGEVPLPVTVVETTEISPTSTAHSISSSTQSSSAEPTDTPKDTVQPATSTSAPLSSIILERRVIGQSVQGRDLSMTVAGYQRGNPVVVIGSIQGDQESTRTLVDAIVNFYRKNEGKIPDNTTFYLIPTINPDGNVSDSRYNAHEVDLNRNWATDDWISNAAVPGYPNGKVGAGGNYPFSEPESTALSDLLNQLEADFPRLRVVILHASVHRSSGEVYPGGSKATSIAEAYANAANYDIEYEWDKYVTSGEAVTWCEEQGIPAVDIVIPASQSPSTQIYGNLTLLDVTVKALEAISQ
jgi:hypothetical protein